MKFHIPENVNNDWPVTCKVTKTEDETMKYYVTDENDNQIIKMFNNYNERIGCGDKDHPYTIVFFGDKIYAHKFLSVEQVKQMIVGLHNLIAKQIGETPVDEINELSTFTMKPVIMNDDFLDRLNDCPDKVFKEAVQMSYKRAQEIAQEITEEIIKANEEAKE